MYWRWWWRHHASFSVKLSLAFVLVCALGVVYMTATRAEQSVSVSAASPPSAAPTFADDFDLPLRNESLLYQRWKTLNPLEAANYEAYADQVKIGLAPEPPVMRTPLGRALVAAARIAADDEASPRPLAGPERNP